MKLLLIPWLFFLSSCGHLFFQPSKEQFSTPEKYKIKYSSLYFNSLDGTKLHAWVLKNASLKKPKSTIIFFHGNAENLSSHFLNLAWLTRYGHDIFVFDYRGYGKSEGTPDQKGAHMDGLAALEQAYHHHKEVGSEKFIVYGQSLGGIISLRALAEFKHRSEVTLLVQDSTFSSYKSIAFDKLKEYWPTWPLSPLAYILVSDSYSSKDFAKLISPTPILVIHGLHDQVVPFKNGKKLFDLASSPKWMWEIENGIHTDVFLLHGFRYRRKFLKFLEELPPRT